MGSFKGSKSNAITLDIVFKEEKHILEFQLVILIISSNWLQYFTSFIKSGPLQTVHCTWLSSSLVTAYQNQQVLGVGIQMHTCLFFSKRMLIVSIYLKIAIKIRHNPSFAFNDFMQIVLQLSIFNINGNIGLDYEFYNNRKMDKQKYQSNGRYFKYLERKSQGRIQQNMKCIVTQAHMQNLQNYKLFLINQLCDLQKSYFQDQAQTIKMQSRVKQAKIKLEQIYSSLHLQLTAMGSEFAKQIKQRNCLEQKLNSTVQLSKIIQEQQQIIKASTQQRQVKQSIRKQIDLLKSYELNRLEAENKQKNQKLTQQAQNINNMKIKIEKLKKQEKSKSQMISQMNAKMNKQNQKIKQASLKLNEQMAKIQSQHKNSQFFINKNKIYCEKLSEMVRNHRIIEAELQKELDQLEYLGSKQQQLCYQIDSTTKNLQIQQRFLMEQHQRVQQKEIDHIRDLQSIQQLKIYQFQLIQSNRQLHKQLKTFHANDEIETNLLQQKFHRLNNKQVTKFKQVRSEQKQKHKQKNHQTNKLSIEINKKQEYNQPYCQQSSLRSNPKQKQYKTASNFAYNFEQEKENNIKISGVQQKREKDEIWLSTCTSSSFNKRSYQIPRQISEIISKYKNKNPGEGIERVMSTNLSSKSLSGLVGYNKNNVKCSFIV